MATLNFLTENIEQADECLKKALKEIMGKSKDNGEVIPRSIVYSLIYLNLRKGDTKSALNLIKR